MFASGGTIALPRAIATWLRDIGVVKRFETVPDAQLQFSFSYEVGDDIVSIDAGSSYLLENGYGFGKVLGHLGVTGSQAIAAQLRDNLSAGQRSHNWSLLQPAFTKLGIEFDEQAIGFILAGDTTQLVSVLEELKGREAAPVRRRQQQQRLQQQGQQEQEETKFQTPSYKHAQGPYSQMYNFESDQRRSWKRTTPDGQSYLSLDDTRSTIGFADIDDELTEMKSPSHSFSQSYDGRERRLRASFVESPNSRSPSPIRMVSSSKSRSKPKK